MTDVIGSRWFNALVGGIVTIILSFTVVSSIFGGALAGYLEHANGIRIGAIAGGISAVPIVLVAMVFAGLIQIPGDDFSGFEIALSFTVIFAIPIFIVGLSILGGYLGVAIRQGTEGDVWQGQQSMGGHYVGGDIIGTSLPFFLNWRLDWVL